MSTHVRKHAAGPELNPLTVQLVLTGVGLVVFGFAAVALALLGYPALSVLFGLLTAVALVQLLHLGMSRADDAR